MYKYVQATRQATTPRGTRNALSRTTAPHATHDAPISIPLRRAKVLLPFGSRLAAASGACWRCCHLLHGGKPLTRPLVLEADHKERQLVFGLVVVGGGGGKGGLDEGLEEG